MSAAADIKKGVDDFLSRVAADATKFQQEVDAKQQAVGSLQTQNSNLALHTKALESSLKGQQVKYQQLLANREKKFDKALACSVPTSPKGE